MNVRSHSILFLLAIALVMTGCDQSSQNVDPENANRYIISQANSSAGDAEAGSFATNEVAIPDTVDFYVQGFTIDKSYSWSVNDSDVPVAEESDETHAWERRDSEFITVVFTQDDPLAEVDPTGSTTNTITVDASEDDIDPETIEVTASVQNPASEQLGRIGTFANLADSVADANLGEALDESGRTVLAPNNEAFRNLDASPTVAVDDDEDPASSVLADLLRYHVVPDSLSSGSIPDGTAQTLFGDQTVSFDTGDGITVNGSNVVRSDIPATNGFVHSIDQFLLPSTASVDFTDRTFDEGLASGDTLHVDGSFIADDGGFIVLHDSTALEDQDAVASTVGVSEYIEPNSVANEVPVVLDDAVADTTTIGARPYRDSNDNEAYDFDPLGAEDGPYTLEGSAVIDYADINISDDS